MYYVFIKYCSYVVTQRDVIVFTVWFQNIIDDKFESGQNKCDLFNEKDQEKGLSPSSNHF